MDTKKPYIIAVIIVVIYTGMYVVSKAAFENGMNSFVFVFYRQAAASLLMLPITLLLERKNMRSMLSSRLLLKLFFYALIGNTLGPNLCNISLKDTSATVVSATGNSTPVITFCFALLLRMETVKLKSSSGRAKVAGIALCLAGALVIAFYTGPSLRPVNRHHQFHPNVVHKLKTPNRGLWIVGTFLMVLSNVTWSLWMVLQAALLKEYPNKLLVTTAQCVFSTVQSFVMAAAAERDFSRWKLHLDVSLLAVLYTGIVVTGVAYYLQAWCVSIRGPVFLAIWNPLVFVLTVFCSSFFIGEIVHLGSILGGIMLVGGLYSMLWGKHNESNSVQDRQENGKEFGNNEQQEEATSRTEVELV